MPRDGHHPCRLVRSSSADGTSRVGGIFGPAMILWFCRLGLSGSAESRASQILFSLDPFRGVHLLTVACGWLAFVVFGRAFLAVTGGEAFYADVGHFGPLPIRVAWFTIVLPGLFSIISGKEAC